MTVMGNKAPIGAWSPPSGTNTNSVTIPAYGTGTSVGGPGDTCSAQIQIQATITATWVPDPNLPSDPAPPSVVIVETGDATARTTNPDGSVKASSVSDGVSDSPDATGHAFTQSTIPVLHQSRQSGGSFTLSRTFSASASGTGSAPFTDSHGVFHNGVASVTASLNSYTVSIHAQPYHLYLDSANGPGDGSIIYKYAWWSTSGSLSDILPSCTVHENVSYAGNPGTYFTDPTKNYPLGLYVYAPPSPPVAAGTEYAQPTITPLPTDPPLPGSQGYLYDQQFAPGFQTPYSPLTYTASQYYMYNDTATGEQNVPIPGQVSFPILIVRSITQRNLPPPYNPNAWWFSLTKDGIQTWLLLPNQ